MYIKRYLLDDIVSSFPFAVEFKGNFLQLGQDWVLEKGASV